MIPHRRRISQKAKVVAAGWGMELNAALFIQLQDDLKKRINRKKILGEMDDSEKSSGLHHTKPFIHFSKSSIPLSIFYSIYPFLHIILALNLYFQNGFPHILIQFSQTHTFIFQFLCTKECKLCLNVEQQNIVRTCRKGIRYLLIFFFSPLFQQVSFKQIENEDLYCIFKVQKKIRSAQI